MTDTVYNKERFIALLKTTRLHVADFIATYKDRKVV